MPSRPSSPELLGEARGGQPPSSNQSPDVRQDLVLRTNARMLSRTPRASSSEQSQSVSSRSSGSGREEGAGRVLMLDRLGHRRVTKPDLPVPACRGLPASSIMEVTGW